MSKFHSSLYEVSPKASRQDKFLNATSPLKLSVVALALAFAVTLDVNLWLRLGLGVIVILVAYVWLKLPQRPARTQFAGSLYPAAHPPAFAPQASARHSQKQALLERAARYEKQAGDPRIDPVRRDGLLAVAQRCRRAAETHQ
jgi:type IV secretory pathway TrbD component